MPIPPARALDNPCRPKSGMCISGVLQTTERILRQLILPLGPNWVGTDSAV